MKNRSFARFARVILIFIHIAAVLVLSMTWNDPFYNRRREHMMTNSHCFLQTDDINLIPGYLEYILQANWRGIIGILLQEVIFSDDVLAVVDVWSCLSSLFSHSFSRWARPKSSLECVFDFMTEEYETCSRTRSAKEMEDEKHWPGCSRHKCIFIQRYWSQIFVRNCIYMIFHAHWRFKQCFFCFTKKHLEIKMNKTGCKSFIVVGLKTKWVKLTSYWGFINENVLQPHGKWPWSLRWIFWG